MSTPDNSVRKRGGRIERLPFTVQVTQPDHPNLWYSDHVGKCFMVVDSLQHEGWLEVLEDVLNDPDRENIRLIDARHCTVLVPPSPPEARVGAATSQPEVELSTEAQPMSAPDVLDFCKDLLAQRGKERDQPTGERSMGRCVKAFWALYGDGILARGYMSETEGWEFMSMLKKARKAGGVYKGDDFIDDTAYCALAAEAAAKGA